MGNVIEVYVKHMKVPVGTGIGYDLPGHQCARSYTLAVTDKMLPEADKNALDLSLAIAEEKGLKVKVYDTSTLTGKLMALLKGVRKTPTVVTENSRIEGVITKDTLLSRL